MPSNQRPASVAALTRLGSAAGWLARWMLVLALALDLVSAPLHGHVHDSGVDGHAWAAHVDAPEWESAHVEDADSLPSLRHATLTVRAAAEASDLVPDSPASTILLAWWPVFALLPALLSAGEHDRWCAAQPPPDLPDHRSLPPAGRAPPLLA